MIKGDSNDVSMDLKLPDGDKYFGFVNVRSNTFLNYLGLQHMLC